MGELPGVLYVRVIKGSNLAIEDRVSKSSDPYVVLRLGQQAKKTGVKHHTLNPVWDQEFTFTVNNTTSHRHGCSLTAEVWDKDSVLKLKRDDAMGVAEIDLKPLLQESYPMQAGKKVVSQSSSIYLAKDSYIVQQKDGRIVQEVCLKLGGVPSGLLEMRLEWQPGL